MLKDSWWIIRKRVSSTYEATRACKLWRCTKICWEASTKSNIKDRTCDTGKVICSSLAYQVAIINRVSIKSTNVVKPRFTPRNHAPGHIESQILWNFWNPSFKNTLLFEKKISIVATSSSHFLNYLLGQIGQRYSTCGNGINNNNNTSLKQSIFI